MRGRLPPGQRWVDEPIVYDIAPVPPLGLGEYRLRVDGEVERPLELSWGEVLRLPAVESVADFHCVTGWSVRGLRWTGVPGRAIAELARPRPGVAWVMAYGREGYTTVLPYEAFLREDTLLAYGLNGEALPPRHGWPLRLVVPSLYAWKSAKYLVRLEFLKEKRLGYWEERGYHDRGDPWREERYR